MLATSAALVLPGTAGAATHEATANGNAFIGGLSFEPRELKVAVGDTVRWTNTDAFVPHTVTEKHELFDLAGTYGGTPANPPGFAPGSSVERIFSAGSFDYFCRVHEEMLGVVEAPAGARVKGKGKRRKVVAKWGGEKLPQGQVFDVQRSVNGARFKKVEDGTRELRGKYEAKRGDEVAFRARVRLESDPSRASGYSPATEVKVR